MSWASKIGTKEGGEDVQPRIISAEKLDMRTITAFWREYMPSYNIVDFPYIKYNFEKKSYLKLPVISIEHTCYSSFSLYQILCNQPENYRDYLLGLIDIEDIMQID